MVRLDSIALSLFTREPRGNLQRFQLNLERIGFYLLEAHGKLSRPRNIFDKINSQSVEIIRHVCGCFNLINGWVVTMYIIA